MTLFTVRSNCYFLYGNMQNRLPLLSVTTGASIDWRRQWLTVLRFMATITTGTHFVTSLPFYLLLILWSRSPQTHFGTVPLVTYVLVTIPIGTQFWPSLPFHFLLIFMVTITTGTQFGPSLPFYLLLFFMETITIGIQFGPSLLYISYTFLRHLHSDNNVLFLHCYVTRQDQSSQSRLAGRKRIAEPFRQRNKFFFAFPLSFLCLFMEWEKW